MPTMAVRNDSGRWRRRAISIPLLLVAAAASPLAVLLSPLLAVLDGLTGRTTARAALFLSWYLLCELLGLLACVLAWAGSGGGRDRDRLIRWSHIMQRRWAAALTDGLVWLFDLQLRVEGQEETRGGPLLLLVRHASMADTVLPMMLVALPNRYRARYVLKAELQWDPCLDVVGHRLPNAFIRRGDGASEIDAIAALGRDLPGDGLVVLFPEGSRFSPRKQARRVADLQSRRDPLLAEARALKHTLPPRSGGALGLVDAAPGVDVAFCAHTGLDGIRRMSDLTNGALLRRTVRVRFWRVPAARIPQGFAARRRWLFAQWGEIDAWIDAARRV